MRKGTSPLPSTCFVLCGRPGQALAGECTHSVCGYHTPPRLPIFNEPAKHVLHQENQTWVLALAACLFLNIPSKPLGIMTKNTTKNMNEKGRSRLGDVDEKAEVAISATEQSNPSPLSYGWASIHRRAPLLINSICMCIQPVTCDLLP